MIFVKQPGSLPPLCKFHNYNLFDLFKVAKQSPFFGIGSLYSGAFAMTPDTEISLQTIALTAAKTDKKC
jgi:hypothetical protein